jgi:DNA-directed RNA polymerase specialized sigma24 family protein
MYKVYEELMIEDFEDAILDEIMIKQLVHNLPPDKIAVIALKLSDGFTTEEMSDILGISTGTIWSRFKTALKILKQKVRKNI